MPILKRILHVTKRSASTIFRDNSCAKMEIIYKHRKAFHLRPGSVFLQKFRSGNIHSMNSGIDGTEGPRLPESPCPWGSLDNFSLWHRCSSIFGALAEFRNSFFRDHLILGRRLRSGTRGTPPSVIRQSNISRQNELPPRVNIAGTIFYYLICDEGDECAK